MNLYPSAYVAPYSAPECWEAGAHNWGYGIQISGFDIFPNIYLDYSCDSLKICPCFSRYYRIKSYNTSLVEIFIRGTELPVYPLNEIYPK